MNRTANRTLRIATFNIESLGSSGHAQGDLDRRIEILRPQLIRLDADILCLQEVNAQHVSGRSERAFVALDALLAGTRYAGCARATSEGSGPGRPADVHNLAILSSFPIVAYRDLRHDLVPPLTFHATTRPAAAPPEDAIAFDRPVLIADIEIAAGHLLTVFNAHLRAPRAAAIAGQKLSGSAWATTSGWAEGFFIASLKRNAQALEMRLEIDRLMDSDPHRWIVVAGDLNARDGEVPLKLLLAAEDDTGNAALAARSLVPVERSIAADQRFSVIHHGNPQTLDHILVTRSLLGHFRHAEVHNEALVDEAASPLAAGQPIGSFHAPVVAEFVVD